MLARAAAQGLAVRAAFENEFTLARRDGDAFVVEDLNDISRQGVIHQARPSGFRCDLICGLRCNRPLQSTRPTQQSPGGLPSEYVLPDFAAVGRPVFSFATKSIS
jgi:hypothetical protein